MRRFTVRACYTFLLMLLIIGTPMIVVTAAETNNQAELAVSLLQQFCGNVSALPNEAFENVRLADLKKNTLCNKVDAVIQQIEAGAYRGSLNKLQNDVENAVVNWVTGEWEGRLIGLIEHIIDVIRGIYCVDSTPPTIHEVYQYPRTPEYDDYVLVLAHVTDSKSGVANVTLSYSVNLGENINMTMNKTDDLYVAEIPPQPYNVTVTYLVYACDRAGNVAISAEYSYVVGDYHPPVISYVERVPPSPNYNETVLIFANVTEPMFASGVREVILSYNNGTVWTDVTMSFNGTLYAASIPAHPYGTLVQYRIYAVDNAGNWAAVDIYSYTTTDRFLPVAMIIAPVNGSYLSGCVNVEVFVHDDNLYEAMLKVNGTPIDSWNETGLHTYTWNTTIVNDGVYILALEAYDQAGNTAEHTVSVTVDNTPPTVGIQWPLNGSYVKGTVSVNVSAEDANFEEMELTIGDFVQVWEVGGNQAYTWNTSDCDDGLYAIALTARDKAGNEAETSLSVVVDNTAPVINNFTWTPSEPVANETVNASVQIFEEESGIKNVTLWFKVNDGAWENLTMTVQNSNWTCTIPGQNENATVRFYVECYDNAENFATTVEKSYTVKATYVSGFPLHWLLLIIGVILAALGSTVYFFKFRKKRSTS